MRHNDDIWNYLSDDEDDYPDEVPYHYQDKYLYDYQWYHEKFPEEWAVNHTQGTGPGQCNNCANYGSINGIFIGYCANCADYIYNGGRCRGFIDNGIEYNEERVSMYQSAFDTYLKDVDIFAIQAVDGETKEVLNDIDDYEYADCEDNTEISVMNCHFEGGYNDF
jgi:hypothetical protein